MAEEDFVSEQSAVYEVNGERVIITLDAARQMQRALNSYLRDHPDELSGYTFRTPGDAWIDSTGTVRFGAWLLDVVKGRLAMSLRTREGEGGPRGYRAVAFLKRHDRTWTVESLQIGRVF